MRYIILDTSFLMALAELRFLSLSDLTRFYPNARLITTRSVIKELESFLKGKRRVSASVALQVIERHGVLVEEGYGGEADEDLIALAKELGGVVATFDLELKERLLSEGIPVIYLRAGKKLVLDDPLRLSKES